MIDGGNPRQLLAPGGGMHRGASLGVVLDIEKASGCDSDEGDGDRVGRGFVLRPN